MADTVPIYGINKTTKIVVNLPCATTTPTGNRNLSTYMDRLSLALNTLIQTKNIPEAKSNLDLILIEMKTSNPTIPFP